VGLKQAGLDGRRDDLCNVPEQNLIVFEHLPPESIFAREMEIVL
jgi:hypothetical protein